MKEGMTIQGLAVEIKRRSENKHDYYVPTRGLSLEASPVAAEIAAAAQAGVLSAITRPVDGGRHVALADWVDAGMPREGSDAGVAGNGNGHSIHPRVDYGLVVPTREGDHHLAINEVAHDQLAQHLKIPATYYDTLRVEDPDLLVTNVNRRCAMRPSSELRLVRSLDGTARAFLSNIYETLDNWDLMRFLMPLFAPRDTRLTDGTIIKALRGPDGQPLQVTFRSCDVTDKNLHIKIIANQIRTELKVGQVVCAGVYIKNSEVGFGKIGVYPFCEVLNCTNGAIITEFSHSQRHVGQRKGGDIDGNDASRFFAEATKRARDKAFFLQMADVVRGTLTEATFNRMLEPMREGMGRAITGHTQAAVEVVGRMGAIGDEGQDAIMKYLIDGGDLTQWGLGNAVTRYSQDVDSYDDATDLETLGGRILTMPADMWKEIGAATLKKRRGSNS